MNYEETMKALERRSADYSRCEECPYGGACTGSDYESHVCADALVHLKRKEEEIAELKQKIDSLYELRASLRVAIECIRIETLNQFADELYEKLYTLPTIYNAHFRRLVDEVKQKLEDEDRA